MYYIAYGSNLNFKLMRSRCPRARPVFYLNGVRVNKLSGWSLSFNRYANIIKNNNGFVPIGLWKITKHCEKELDIYENFPILYSKIYFKYYSIKAMTYVMNSNKLLKPSNTYLKLIYQGYEDFNLNPGYLKNI